ncbi:MAG: hypothetical protein KKA16_15015 [Alphaproteobacteria bacterium]|nr:hypothetical protein [Alphaproteobacteria bacterium]MBU2380091.1 hypothetical protein [Alphaproteobacteria bacterium]
MLETPAENAPDRRPAILVCVYEADDPALAALDDPAGAPWNPAGARTLPVGHDDPAVLADRIRDELNQTDCRAVLLVGRTRRSDAFRIQMRAENRTLTGGGKLTVTGPAMARATAPVAEMVRALNDAGLNADATSDSEDDAGSYLLYRVLTALPDDADVAAVGLLRAPASLDNESLRRGVQTAAATMARHLSPLPRARLA